MVFNFYQFEEFNRIFSRENTKYNFYDKLLSGVWHIIWMEVKELDEIVITNTFHSHLFTTINKFSQQLPLLKWWETGTNQCRNLH